MSVGNDVMIVKVSESLYEAHSIGGWNLIFVIVDAAKSQKMSVYKMMFNHTQKWALKNLLPEKTYHSIEDMSELFNNDFPNQQDCYKLVHDQLFLLDTLQKKFFYRKNNEWCELTLDSIF